METSKENKKEHIIQSKLPDIIIPNHLPTHTYIFQNLSNHFSRPALINAATGQIFTHGDVHLISRRLAVGFLNLGIRRNDVVLLLLHNSPAFAFSFLAASFIGATITTANPLYTSEEITNQSNISKPKLIITHSTYIEKVEPYALKNGVRIVSLDSCPSQSANVITFADLINSDERMLPEIDVSPEDTVVLPFSSGTTGLPKGVMLSHKNLVTCISQQVDGDNTALHIDSRDLTICVLPMFHVFSLITVFLCNIRVGAAVLIVKKFEINGLMDLVDKYKVTIAPFVPPILLAIAKSKVAGERYDLSSVRRVICGAAPLDKKLEDSVRVKLPNATIGQGYGMTEAGVLSMCLGFAKRPFKFKAGSCGTVIRNARMKIVDPSTGASLPRNQRGEICIRGDAVMKGYFNDPEATKRTIDNEGWLHSGDIGYVDDDDELFIVDRLKELIKYKGFHVAPAELEALLIAHPSISDAAVVPMIDEDAGEVPVAFVVRENGSSISDQEIKQYISNQVAQYKRISRVFFTDQIPKAPSGKILRKVLRARI